MQIQFNNSAISQLSGEDTLGRNIFFFSIIFNLVIARNGERFELVINAFISKALTEEIGRMLGIRLFPAGEAKAKPSVSSKIEWKNEEKIGTHQQLLGYSVSFFRFRLYQRFTSAL